MGPGRSTNITPAPTTPMNMSRYSMSRLRRPSRPTRRPAVPPGSRDPQPDRPIGNGAFGGVRSVTDPRDGNKVALKNMPNIFRTSVSAERVFRELMMLYYFQHKNDAKHDGITQPWNTRKPELKVPAGQKECGLLWFRIRFSIQTHEGSQWPSWAMARTERALQAIQWSFGAFWGHFAHYWHEV